MNSKNFIKTVECVHIFFQSNLFSPELRSAYTRVGLYASMYGTWNGLNLKLNHQIKFSFYKPLKYPALVFALLWSFIRVMKRRMLIMKCRCFNKVNFFSFVQNLFYFFILYQHFPKIVHIISAVLSLCPK